MAAATWLPSPAAVAVALLAGALWLARRPADPAGGRRRWGAALVLVATGAAIGGALHELAAARVASATDLRESHAGLWEELEATAARTATRLARLADADRRARFATLRAAAEADGLGEVNLLLWDRFGDLEAWWGPGALPELSGPGSRDRERRVVPSALSSTLYVTRRFPDAAGVAWTLVAAESFPHDGPPPVRRADRDAWRSAAWSLQLDGEAEPPTWRLLSSPGLRRAANAGVWRATARVATGMLLLLLSSSVVAAAGGRWPAAAGVGATLGLAVVASGYGASNASALALAAAVAALATVLAWSPRPPASTAARLAALAAAATAGPALLLAARWLHGLPRLGGELALLDPTVGSWRLAAVAVVAAAIAVSLRLGTPAPAATSAPRVVVALAPLAAAALAAALADYALPAAVALAAAGGGVGAALLAGRLRSRSGRLGVLLAASLIAAAAASIGERQAEMDRLTAELERQLPPAPDRVASFAAGVEGELAALDPGELALAAPGEAVPEDLAFALWRRTSLARPDVLSSLAVVGPDGSRAVYSSGLPLDAAGRLDLSPTRWLALAPPAWLDRRTGGERTRRDARQREWFVQWLAVPLPGFPRSEPAGVDGGRAVLYERGGRVARSPWAEGTPPLDAGLASLPPFRRYRATPDGPARVAARAEGGYVAAIFLPLATPAVAFERAGSFLAGAWLPALAIALLLGAATHSWRALERELRSAWRSYSMRLVLVFSAFLLLPIAAASSWVAHAYARQLEQQQDASALDALHAAQRILGEYVLSLEPGFGIGTAVDDRLLEWLSRVVRSEVHLYWGSELYASSKRDLFSAGLQPARLSGEIWQRIHIDGERVARRERRTAGDEAIEIYAALEIPGLAPEATKLVLALPQAARQNELAAAVAGVRRRAFLVAATLALLLAVAGAVLARRFARPIEAIVDGTQRIADGAPSLGYAPDELELEALATAIDRMAAKIAEARERLLAEKRLVERIAENVTAAVVGLDAGGRVVFANRLARERVHAAPGEPLGERLREAGGAVLARALVGAARPDEPVSARVDLGAGEREWTLVRAALPGPGEPSELVVIEDVTDVVRAQRLDAWAGMARIIAHEIKNPLTPIRLSTEHLREAWARDREHFAAVFERCTDNILRQVEELRQTASEFSLYSEIPRIERRPGDLREAIGEVVEAYRAAPPAGIVVEFDADGPRVPASFDRRLLGRAVRNLIENAVRASASGGRVEIAVEAGA
ncbi:MAG: hypothetical protein NDJ75_05390, partial [Thermoanaerobaculia bacterium]|nr:hypothetical protein [Thermoanaerobaculia bacterium]